MLDAVQDDPTIAAFIGQFDADVNLPGIAREFAAHSKYRGFRVSASAVCDPNVLDGAPGIVELLGNYHDTWKLIPYMASHPERQFIVEHIGGYLFDGSLPAEDYGDFFQSLAALPNTAVKLSGLYTLCRLTPKPAPLEAAALFRGIAETVLQTLGEDRCMFGSDWPVMGVPYPWTVEVTQRLCGALSPSAWDKVSDSNARRIYNL